MIEEAVGKCNTKKTLLMDTLFASTLKLLTLYNSEFSEATLRDKAREIKNNLWWVVDPEIAIIQLINEIFPGDSFDDLITAYACCIKNFNTRVNWGNINQAITDLWGRKQLDYIKVQAWKEVDARV